MQPETRFKLRVVKHLRELKPLGLWWVKTQMVAVRGIPDLILCAGGVFIAWELKVGSNSADRLQELTLSEIRRAKGVASVVNPQNLDVHLLALTDILTLPMSEVGAETYLDRLTYHNDKLICS